MKSDMKERHSSTRRPQPVAVSAGKVERPCMTLVLWATNGGPGLLVSSVCRTGCCAGCCPAVAVPAVRLAAAEEGVLVLLAAVADLFRRLAA